MTQAAEACALMAAEWLVCPETGSPVTFQGDAFVASSPSKTRFPIEEGIVRAFVPHDGRSRDVTDPMKAFYEEHPFPNYDDLDDVGSLIEKSIERGFPEMLNRSIPLRATVLEVGCGTGQLGNFLSVPGRRVLSVDMCLNSLRLAQGFKARNELGSVTFAQANLFRLPLRPASFDVVICTGVLHHTSDPRTGFNGLLPFVKSGGHVLVGLYNRYGRMQTRLRRVFFKIFGARFASIDPYLRSRRLADGKRRAWFKDQYENPHESFHTMDQVLDWFDAVGIRFVRAVPGTVFGTGIDFDYRRSLFEAEPRGSRSDRLLAQLRQMTSDIEGGLFVMIGQKQ